MTLPQPAAPGDPRTDPDLADVRAAQRDRAAFGVLYRRYVERIYGYCFYLLGDHHDAEDATERTFVSALAAVDRFRDDGASFRSWLFRIAHNELANRLRDRGRHRTTVLETHPEPAVDDDPARLVVEADDAQRSLPACRRIRGAAVVDFPRRSAGAPRSAERAPCGWLSAGR